MVLNILPTVILLPCERCSSGGTWFVAESKGKKKKHTHRFALYSKIKYLWSKNKYYLVELFIFFQSFLHVISFDPLIVRLNSVSPLCWWETDIRRLNYWDHMVKSAESYSLFPKDLGPFYIFELLLYHINYALPQSAPLLLKGMANNFYFGLEHFSFPLLHFFSWKNN